MQFFSRPRTVPARRALSTGAAALALSVLFASAAAAGSPTTSSVIKSVKAALAKQSGARVVSVASSSSSSTKEKETTDFGASTGEETMSAGAADLTIKVTPTGAYVSGSPTGLTTIFGVSATDAKTIGTDWVVWTAGTTQYSDLQKNVAVSSLTTVLPTAKGTKLSTRTIHGAMVYALKWSQAATSTEAALSITLTVSAKTHLPLTATTTETSGATVTTTFSHWGKTVAVDPPAAGSTIPGSQFTTTS